MFYILMEDYEDLRGRKKDEVYSGIKQIKDALNIDCNVGSKLLDGDHSDYNCIVKTCKKPCNEFYFDYNYTTYILETNSLNDIFYESMTAGMRFLKDLERAKEFKSLELYNKLVTDVTYKVIENEEDISFDTEWSLDIETRGFDWINNNILCVGISNGFNNYIIDASNLSNFKSFFSDSRINFILHNAKFDIKFLKEQYDIEIKNYDDTMLMAYSMDERRGINSLGFLSSYYLGVEEYKGKIKFATIEADDPLLLEYLAKDALYTFYLRKVLTFLMREQNFILYNQTLIPASKSLTEVEMNGIGVDLNYAKALDNFYDSKIKNDVKICYYI